MAEYATQLRVLVDAKAEARMKTMTDITSKTAATFNDVPPEEAYRITLRNLATIEQQFIKNILPNYRRGGMASVKATISGVPDNRRHHLEFLKTCADLVFPLFGDNDVSVRLAALETAHEMVRKFQSQLFATSFVEMFRALLAIMNDRDKRCLQLGREISNTVREYVTGAEAGAFSPDAFVSFLTEALEPLLSPCADVPDSHVVQWILEWIRHVYDLPSHELVLQLPRFLVHMFYLNARCPSPEAEKIMERSLNDTKRAYQQGLDINVADLLSTSVDCVAAIDVASTRKLALDWTTELLQLGGMRMLSQSHNILESVLPQLGAKDVPIRISAGLANSTLMDLLVKNESASTAGAQHGGSEPTPVAADVAVAQQPSQSAATSGGGTPISLAYYPILQTIMHHLDVKAKEETRLTCLDWFLVIRQVRPDIIREHFESVFESVLQTLGDHSDSVMHRSIDVLHLITDEDRFAYFVDRLLLQFQVRAPVLLPKAPTIIKQLQLRYQGDTLESCEKLLLKIAELLPQRDDLRLVEKLVIVLSTMLLTAKEFLPLRDVLRKGVRDQRARETFFGLYGCWCFDVTAAIALCLLTTAYGQAYRLVVLLGLSEMSPQTLVQVDRLVQLLESPVFSFLRISLLQPTRHVALVKTMFGLQMILPQASPQYKSLSARLKAVPSIAQLEMAAESSGRGADIAIDDRTPAVTATAAVTGNGATSANAVDVSEGTDVVDLSVWLGLVRNCEEVQRRILSYETALRAIPS